MNPPPAAPPGRAGLGQFSRSDTADGGFNRYDGRAERPVCIRPGAHCGRKR